MTDTRTLRFVNSLSVDESPVRRRSRVHQREFAHPVIVRQPQELAGMLDRPVNRQEHAWHFQIDETPATQLRDELFIVHVWAVLVHQSFPPVLEIALARLVLRNEKHTRVCRGAQLPPDLAFFRRNERNARARVFSLFLIFTYHGEVTVRAAVVSHAKRVRSLRQRVFEIGQGDGVAFARQAGSQGTAEPVRQQHPHHQQRKRYHSRGPVPRYLLQS